MTDSVRSSTPPSFNPDRMPKNDRQRDDQQERQSGEDRGIAEAIPYDIVDGQLVQGRIAEVAEILRATRILEVQPGGRILKGIGDCAD